MGVSDTIPCRLCGGSASFRFERAFEAGPAARYYECPACGLLQSTHLDGRAPAEIGRLYAQSPHPLDPGYAWRQYCVATRLRSLFRLGIVGSAAGGRVKVLDVGCGNGWLLGYLAFKHGCEAVGYEPHAGAGEAPAPVHRDWEGAARGGPYDLIVATEVFEHFLDVRREIDRIASVLAPRGAVYVTTGLYDPARCGADWDYLGPSGQHAAFYARRTHAWIAERLGARAFPCGAAHEWLYSRIPGLRSALAAAGLRFLVRTGFSVKIV